MYYFTKLPRKQKPPNYPPSPSSPFLGRRQEAPWSSFHGTKAKKDQSRGVCESLFFPSPLSTKFTYIKYISSTIAVRSEYPVFIGDLLFLQPKPSWTFISISLLISILP